MKLLVIYRPVSDHGSAVDSFVREFSRRNPAVRVELLDIDTREGIIDRVVPDRLTE